MSIQRVAERVRRGGHDIPEETIRRRYRSGLHNFFALYLPLADEWGLYHNLTPEGPELIARGVPGQSPYVALPDVWHQANKEARREP